MLAPVLGAPGLCAATGIALGVSALVYAHILAPGTVVRVFRAVLFPSAAFTAAAAGISLLNGRPLIALSAAAGALAVYYLAGERLGFFEAVPADWRPLNLLKLAFSRLLRLR